MSIGKIKNFVIIALVITAVYQTGMLWLEGSESRNIFYYAFDRVSDLGTGYNDQLATIEPEDLIVGFGDKRFYKTQTDDVADLNKEFDRIIAETIENGVYQGSDTTNWESYLEGKVVLYRFPFVMSMTEYGKSIKTKNKGATYKNISFDIVSITPARSANETNFVNFINTDAGETYEFELNGGAKGSALFDEIEKFQSAQNREFYYLSAKQSGFNIFRQYAFIPQWSGNEYRYDKIQSSVRYINGDKVDQAALEKDISGYFSNFANKQTNIDNGVYTFSNQDTVVKYYDDGVLEYYSYNNSSDSSEQTLATAYTVCKNFLTNNNSIKHSIKLKNIELKNEGLVFYFDYIFEGHDIVLSENLKQNLGVTNALEVVITNNSVKKCRMVAYDFKTLSETDVVEVDFSAALSNVMSVVNLSGDITEVLDMNIAYKVDGIGESGLKWYVAVDSSVYETDTKRDTVFLEEETD